jgi:tetratricopeptide (TPR) repeat protein
MSMRKIVTRDAGLAAVLFVFALTLEARAQSGQVSPPQTPSNESAVTIAGNGITEKDARRKQARQLALDGKYSEAYALGKQALADEPNDLRTLLIVSWSGLFMATSGLPVNNTEVSIYAQKALQMIHEGVVPDPNKPFLAETKEQILGWLEYALGIFMLKTEPEQAVGYLTMAAQSEGFQKYDPQTYALLAVAYEKAQYEELAADYRKRFKTPKQSSTPEGRATMARIMPVINRMIDAYARAVALSGDNPAYAKKKVEWTDQLTEFYKFRQGGSTTGLDALVAAVLSRPLGTVMDSPLPLTQPVVAATAAAKPQTSTPQTATSQSSTSQSSKPQAAASQSSSPRAATPERPARNLSTTTNVPVPTARVAANASLKPRPAPSQTTTRPPASKPAQTSTPPAPISSAKTAASKPTPVMKPATAKPPTPAPSPVPVASSNGLDQMFFSTWSYYLAINTNGGSTVSPVSGTIRFSDKGASFNQDLRIQSAQSSFNYKYSGTFTIEGNKLTLVYRDAQGATKTEVYDFVFSPELKALRLTRDYGRVSTSWILFLKGTESVSRCTEQGKTVLTDAICQQVRKAG